jgi:hypothetical protein
MTIVPAAPVVIIAIESRRGREFMRNNETGELELVLGNRQLLSGFFVVALLFGVAFAMGYIVGRNSAPSPKLQAETAAGGTVAALPDSRSGPGSARGG